MTAEFSSPSPRDGFRADTATRPAAIVADALVVFVHDDAVTAGAAGEIDTATGGLLGRLASAGEITGKRFECTSVLAPAGIAGTATSALAGVTNGSPPDSAAAPSPISTATIAPLASRLRRSPRFTVPNVIVRSARTYAPEIGRAHV